MMQDHAQLVVDAVKRATPTEIHNALDMPSEIPEHFLAFVNDVTGKGPASYGAASWLARFDAINVIEAPITISPMEIGEQLLAHNRVVLVSTLHTFRFWMTLIRDMNLSGKLLAKAPVEAMEAKTLN